MISHVKYLCGLNDSMMTAILISTQSPTVCSNSITRLMGLLGAS